MPARTRRCPHADRSDYEAATGMLSGPPAPPRDGSPELGNLMECFSFGADQRARRGRRKLPE